jgi:hypothetical protein
MKAERTNRILLWLNLLLLIIISSAIITFIVMSKVNPGSGNKSGVINSMTMLKDELALTDEQFAKVNLPGFLNMQEKTSVGTGYRSKISSGNKNICIGYRFISWILVNKSFNILRSKERRHQHQEKEKSFECCHTGYF